MQLVPSAWFAGTVCEALTSSGQILDGSTHLLTLPLWRLPVNYCNVDTDALGYLAHLLPSWLV